tara:strand:+ start:2040 stop:2663 length:624 start_codon:yes stop_codon:yes gene_type:complete
MSNKLVFFTGILGVTFFGVTSFLGGFQFEDYDPISQYISETMAVDMPYGKYLRFFGYIPSGILLTIFAFVGYKRFPKSNLTKFGFWGMGIFYGIATIVVGIFPCDKGCNKELVDPSVSQLIHNLTGLLTYLFVPISILMISIGLWKSKKYSSLSKIGIICGIISIVFIGFLFDPLTNYAGLFQRIIEGIFILWIIACSIYIKRGNEE